LREHYITRDKGAFGSKTQAQFYTTCLVNLVHVHSCAAVDAVFSPAIASDDIEVALSVKLLALTRRKPLSQKTQTARLASVFATIAPIKLA
jgi:hypothetical protein